MEFTTPLGLLALLSLPAVLALHFFRRKLREQRVSGLFLFQKDALPADAGRQRSRLLQTPSLYLELLAALLVSLWLSGFSVGLSDHRSHVIVVLDDSASMQATAAVAGGEQATGKRVSGADLVRQRLADLVAQAPSGSRCTLMLSGRRARVLLGPRAPIHLLADTVRGWRPGSPEHDFLPALELGLEVAAPGDDLVFLTDHAVDTPTRYRCIAVGQSLPNCGIVAANRSLVEAKGAGQDDREKLEVVLSAWTDEPAVTTRLTIRLGTGSRQTQIFQRDLELRHGELVPLALSFPKTSQPWNLSLAADALAVDNVVRLLPGRPKQVLLATDLDQRLVARMGLARLARVLPHVALVPAASGCDILISGAAAAAGEGEDTVRVIVRPVGDERDDWIGPFLMERRHPLMSGLSLDGVVFSAGRGAMPGLPLILAGEQVLLTEEQRADAAPRLHLNLDAGRTNLFDTPDWPILVSNLVERVRKTLPGPRQVNLRVGDEILYRLPRTAMAQSADVHLLGPDAVARIGHGRGLLSWEAREPGEHRVLSDGKLIATYSVQFVDAHESDLRRCASFDRAPQGGGGEVARASTSGYLEARVLALLLLLCMVLNWIVLGRRGRGR